MSDTNKPDVYLYVYRYMWEGMCECVRRPCMCLYDIKPIIFHEYLCNTYRHRLCIWLFKKKLKQILKFKSKNYTDCILWSHPIKLYIRNLNYLKMKYSWATLKSKKNSKLKFSTFLKAMTQEIFYTKPKGTAQNGVSNCTQ